jgi:hypothetical protein
VDSLRRPLFVLALILLVITVLVEVGAGAFLNNFATSLGEVRNALPEDEEVREAYEDADDDELERLAEQGKPPGLALLYMALLDSVLLFTMLITASGLVFPQSLQASAQGCLGLIFSLILLILSIIAIIVAIILLLVMVALLLAVPFGTIAYLVLYGFFNRPVAGFMLGALTVLKIGFAILLIASHQRFLQRKGLILLFLTSLIAHVIISFLHGFPPLFLVSITDAIAAIIIAILAVIWLIFLLFGSLVAVVKAARVDRAASR